MHSTVLSKSGLLAPLVLLLAVLNVIFLFAVPLSTEVKTVFILVGYALALVFAYLKDGRG